MNTHQMEIEHRLHCAIKTIAMQSARNEIKDALRRQGKKLSLVPAAELTRLAKARLLAHHERLSPDAARKVREWALEGGLGKRVQRAVASADSVWNVTRNRTLANAHTTQPAGN